MEEQFPGLETPASVPSEQELARLFDSVACFLSHLSSRGALVMVVDDLHWASGSTLQMLHYLARQLVGHPVLLVGTLCPETVGRRHPLRALQRQLSREGLVHLLRLPRLSPEALEAMVVEMSGAGQAVIPLARRLYEETEGNPFFLIETVKALFEEGLIRLEQGIGSDRGRRAWQGDFSRISEGELPLPASLSDAIQARIDHLSNDVREMLCLAAVLGREFDLDLMNLIWGRGDEATLEALGILLRQRLLDEGSGPLGRDYVFTHHKIQEVVYATMQGRRLRHRRVAEVVERLQPNDAVALAWHFERAGEPGRAARYALQAGLAAKAVFAHAEASAHFDRALILLEQESTRLRDPEALATSQRLRIQVLNERGWGLRLLGDMDTYDRDLREVAGLAESLGDQRTLAHLRWRQAYTHRWFCRYNQARKAAEDGVRLSQAAGDASLEALCQREVGMAARATGDHDRSRLALERALGLFADLDDAINEIHVLGNLSTLYCCLGDHGRGMDLARQALARCDGTGLSFERRLPLGDMGAAAAASGDTDLARKWFRESLSIARKIADRTQEILCLGHLGWLCVRESETAGALEHLQAALALAEEIGSCTEQSWLRSGLAEAHILAGDPDQAEVHARQAWAQAQASGRVHDRDLAHQVLGELWQAG
jgi:tetratricopeptide (TPR) repeat protein